MVQSKIGSFCNDSRPIQLLMGTWYIKQNVVVGKMIPNFLLCMYTEDSMRFHQSIELDDDPK